MGKTQLAGTDLASEPLPWMWPEKTVLNPLLATVSSFTPKITSPAALERPNGNARWVVAADDKIRVFVN